MARALSAREAMNIKKRTLDFEGGMYDAFGQPERRGVWFVWGESGNGKTSFVMQLCKELARHGCVAYDSLEEGTALTMINTLRRYGMDEAGNRFRLLDCEKMDELGARMDRHKSPDFYVIDSFQYTQMTYREYIAFKEAHRNKLLIFISHAEGKMPAGVAARKVMYDATLKIYVEGFKAFSKGRFIGPSGEFVIWREGAERYWGGKNEKQD
ncbi:hypothetical protein [Muribaculum intestinale]|uniref:hypothetical protein n=1 Tax=Muribaculum intestinale TaxID=1796646 RepID=UPI003F67EBA1